VSDHLRRDAEPSQVRPGELPEFVAAPGTAEAVVPHREQVSRPAARAAASAVPAEVAEEGRASRPAGGKLYGRSHQRFLSIPWWQFLGYYLR
jgi:hypothetical protein